MNRVVRFPLLICGLVLGLAVGAWAGQDHPSQDYDADTPIDVLHVRGQVYMVVIGGADGVNVVAQVGDDGIFLVDSGPAALADKLIETLREEFDNKPVRFLFNTHSHADHAGGNQALAQAFGGGVFGDVRIAAHVNTLNRLNGYTRDERDVIPPEGRPFGSFYLERLDFHLNGEAIVALSTPSAHTDGDAVVWFRGSDVVATGDAFVMGQFPVIDSERGGSLQGLTDAARFLVDDIAVSEVWASAGTRLVPGHGRFVNEAEVMDSLLMLTIVRSRIQEMVDEGMTLDGVKAARPTMDYDVTFYGDKDFWTTEMFVEAVYREITGSPDVP